MLVERGTALGMAEMLPSWLHLGSATSQASPEARRGKQLAPGCGVSAQPAPMSGNEATIQPRRAPTPARDTRPVLRIEPSRGWVARISSVSAGLIDFILGLAVLIGMMAYYHVTPTRNVVWLPGLVALALVTSLGVGVWLSALNVRFRDVRYGVPFLTQFRLFATPIAYPSSVLPQPWRTPVRSKSYGRCSGRVPLGAARHRHSARPDSHCVVRGSASGAPEWPVQLPPHGAHIRRHRVSVIASVTTGGVVSGVGPGQTSSVATFQGPAGSSTVTLEGR